MEKEKNRNREVDFDNLPILDEGTFSMDDLEYIVKREHMPVNQQNVDQVITETKMSKPILHRTLNKKNYLPIPKFDIVVNLMYRLKEIAMKNTIISELHGRISLLESQLKKHGIDVNITEEDARNLDNVIEATSAMLVDGMRDTGSFNLLPDKMTTKLQMEISKNLVTIKEDTRTTLEYQLHLNIVSMEEITKQIEAVKKDVLLSSDLKAKEIRQLIKARMDLSNNNEKLLGRDKKIIVNENVGHQIKKDPVDVEIAEVNQDNMEDISLTFSGDN